MTNLYGRIYGGAVAGACMALSATLTGCNMDIELPVVQLTLPIANGATVPDVTLKDDKLSFELPEVCDLPDLAALEEEVREALGPAGGLIEIRSVLLDNIAFEATAGNFDFLDSFTLTFRKDDESIDLSTDLSAQTNITEFVLTPGEDEELDIIDLIPGPTECLQAEIDFTGAVPSEETTYDATMQVSIQAVLHL